MNRVLCKTHGCTMVTAWRMPVAMLLLPGAKLDRRFEISTQKLFEICEKYMKQSHVWSQLWTSSQILECENLWRFCFKLTSDTLDFHGVGICEKVRSVSLCPKNGASWHLRRGWQEGLREAISGNRSTICFQHQPFSVKAVSTKSLLFVSILST